MHIYLTDEIPRKPFWIEGDSLLLLAHTTVDRWKLDWKATDVRNAHLSPDPTVRQPFHCLVNSGPPSAPITDETV